MIKWVGNFNYKSFAICIINNTSVWFATSYHRTVEPVKINTLVTMVLSSNVETFELSCNH